jgi:signal transduction histidine kinase
MLASDLMEKDNKAPSTALLARLRRSTERMNDLIMEITQFVKLRFGDGLRPRPEAIEAAALFERVAARVAAAYPRHDEVIFDSEACVLAVDPQLAQVALCGAIGDRLDAGAQPVVWACASDAMVEISIADAGPTSGDDEPLLEPSRACMGLYLAAEITHAHGGEATYRSTEAGTVLTLLLPRSSI